MKSRVDAFLDCLGCAFVCSVCICFLSLAVAAVVAAWKMVLW